MSVVSVAHCHTVGHSVCHLTCSLALQPASAQHQTVHVEEFEPDVFRQLIEYIHTGCVTLQPRTLLGKSARQLTPSPRLPVAACEVRGRPARQAQVCCGSALDLCAGSAFNSFMTLFMKSSRRCGCGRTPVQQKLPCGLCHPHGLYSHNARLK